MHAGKKIKVIRGIKGMSQVMLADKINKTRALISYIEQTGKANHHTLRSILKVFHMSEEDFENFDPKALKLISYPDNSGEDAKVEVLKDKLDFYQKENKVLKELIETQKQMISMLKGKKTKS